METTCPNVTVHVAEGFQLTRAAAPEPPREHSLGGTPDHPELMPELTRAGLRRSPPLDHRAQLLEGMSGSACHSRQRCRTRNRCGDHPLAPDNVGKAAQRSATSSGARRNWSRCRARPDQDLVIGQFHLRATPSIMGVARSWPLDNQRHRWRGPGSARPWRTECRGRAGPRNCPSRCGCGRDRPARCARRGQHLDMEGGALQEIRFAESWNEVWCAIARSGQSSCSTNPAATIASYSCWHRRGDGFDIRFVCRVVAVVLEHRHEARRPRGHEALDHIHLGERLAQVGEVLGQRLAVAQRDRADADRRRATLAPVIRS